MKWNRQPKKSNSQLAAELKKAKEQREAQEKRIKLLSQIEAEKKKIKANKARLGQEGLAGRSKRELSKLIKDAKKLNSDYQKWAGGSSKKGRKKKSTDDDGIDF